MNNIYENGKMFNKFQQREQTLMFDDFVPEAASEREEIDLS